MAAATQQLQRRRKSMHQKFRFCIQKVEGRETNAAVDLLQYPPLDHLVYRKTALPSFHVHGRPAEVEDIFELADVLCTGTFNDVQVAKVKGRSLSSLLAVRLMPKSKVTHNMAIAELMVLRLTVNVPYIVQLQNCFQTATHYGVLLSYPTVAEGSLRRRVQRYNRFSELVARFYLAEIAEGLFYLHDRAIIHRNLTVNNVMIKLNGHVALSDFELSYIGETVRDLPDITCPPWNGINVPELPAPELMAGQDYEKTVDWWSFGIIMYRLICGKLPVSNRPPEPPGMTSVCALPRIVYVPEPYPSTISPEAKNCLINLLARNPRRRTGAGSMERQEVQNEAFFLSVDWDLIHNQALPPPFTDTVAATPAKRNGICRSQCSANGED